MELTERTTERWCCNRRPRLGPAWHFRFLFSFVSSCLWIPLPRLLPRLTEKISRKIKYYSNIAWNFWSHRKTVTIVNHAVSLYIYIYLLHRDNKTTRTIDKWKLINIISILFFLNINNSFPRIEIIASWRNISIPSKKENKSCARR